MGMTRRGLFRGLLGLGAATVLAPVAKFFPAMVMKYRQPGISTLAYDEINAVTQKALVPALADWYFKPRPVFHALCGPKLGVKLPTLAGSTIQVPLQYPNQCDITPLEKQI